MRAAALLCLLAQEVQYALRHGLGLLEVRQMAAVGEYRHLRMAQAGLL